MAIAPQQDVVYAGFWRRWAALFIDQLILGAVFYAVVIVLVIAFGIAGAFDPEVLDPDDPPAAFWIAYMGLLLFYYVGAALYYSLMESSRHQASVGKLALGIKVTDADGGRLTFGRAVARWFAAALSYLTMYIGFLMAAFTDRKRALHDMATDTLVVDRWAFTGHPERQRRELGGCLLAIVAAVALFLAVMVAAILAAIALPAYSDYTKRSQAMVAMAATAPLRVAVDGFAEAEGRCPVNGEAGIAPEKAPGIPNASRLAAGAFDDGSCGLELELGGTGHADLDGGLVWWERLPGGGWRCTSDLPDRLLPEECRG